MKAYGLAVAAVLCAAPSAFGESRVFRCGEPRGAVMWSQEGHKIAPDGFKEGLPVVVIDDKEMRIVWGDSKGAGGRELVWRAVIFHEDATMVNAVSLDASEETGNSAAMMYSADKLRGFLYMSTHKNSALFRGSSAQSFVAKCSTR